MSYRLSDSARMLWRIVLGRLRPSAVRYGTDECRAAIAAAHALSERRCHRFVGTEHLLVGLLDAPEGAVSAALDRAGVRAADVVNEVELWIERADLGPAGPGPARFTPHAKRALEAALVEVRTLGGGPVGGSHLLLALLDDPRGLAVELFRRRGVTVQQLRAELRRAAPAR